MAAKAIIMPKVGITVESCIISEWFVKVGDKITKGEKLFSYETDKTTTSYESEVDGEVLAILASPGDEVKVFANVCIVGKKGDDISQYLSKTPPKDEKTSAKEAPKSDAPPQPVEPNVDKKVPSEVKPVASALSPGQSDSIGKKDEDRQIFLTPRARREAKQLDVHKDDIQTFSGSGPHHRALSQDVWQAKQNLSIHAHQQTVAEAAQIAPKRDNAVPSLSYDTVSYSPIRSAIAGKMSESLAKTAQVTLFTSFNASNIFNFRKQLKNTSKIYQLPKITVNDIFIFVLSRILPNYPSINAVTKNNTIIPSKSVNISIAVDNPKGLMVPVIDNTQKMSLRNIAIKSKELILLVKNGKITPANMQNGTFTISNMGLLNVSYFTPIINYPQVAILGVGTAKEAIKMVDGKIVTYPEISLSLTFDHRPIDGADAGRFLTDLTNALTNFESLFLVE